MKPMITICATAAIILMRGAADAAPDAPRHAVTNETRMTKPMMKGMELHAWTNANGEWNYALLTGTNDRKSTETIRAPAHTITTLDRLKQRIALLAEGEFLVWTGDGPRPPAEIQKQISDLCARLKIKHY